MIRNESEYQEAVRRLREEQERIERYRKCMEDIGLAADDVQRMLDPLCSFHEQLSEEIKDYERLKRYAIIIVDRVGGSLDVLGDLPLARGCPHDPNREPSKS